MKTVLIILGLLVAGYFAYQRLHERVSAGPPVATDPYYMEIRASNTFGSREVEVALFARALDERDCIRGTNAGWAKITKACPTCTAKPPKCSKDLPPRYARLFDDQPIPSTYLSATAATGRERDIRVVFYGLTDEEGMATCQAAKTELAKNYTGTSHCVAASE